MCSQCTHGQGRSEQKPQSPKLPPAAAKYAPQPPAGLPRAQLACGGQLGRAEGGVVHPLVQDPTQIYLQLDFLARLPVGRFGQQEVLQGSANPTNPSNGFRQIGFKSLAGRFGKYIIACNQAGKRRIYW